MSLIAIAVMGQYLGHVYVPPHPPETVPCPLAAVQQELVHGRHFNRISVGDVFIETDQGSVNCSQQYVEACTAPSRGRVYSQCSRANIPWSDTKSRAVQGLHLSLVTGGMLADWAAGSERTATRLCQTCQLLTKGLNLLGLRRLS